MAKSTGAEHVLELDVHEVKVTSADKVFFSERGDTKLDLVEHAAYGNGVTLQRYDVVHAAG